MKDSLQAHTSSVLFIRFCKLLYQEEKKKIRAIRSKYEETQVDYLEVWQCKIEEIIVTSSVCTICCYAIRHKRVLIGKIYKIN